MEAMFSKNSKNRTSYEFIRDFGIVGFSYVLFLVRGLIVIALLTKNLPAEDYGLWVLYYKLTSIIPMVITLGLPFGLTRFLSGKTDREKSRTEFYTVLFVIIVIALSIFPLLFIALSQVASGREDQLEMNLIFCLIIVIESINLAFLNYVRARKRFFGYLLLTGLQNFSIIGLIWAFASQGNISVIIALLSLLIADLVVFVSSGVLFLTIIRIASPRISLIKKYFKLGIPLVPSNMASWVITSGDRYIIAWFLSLTLVGYYSPAHSLASMVFNILISPMGLILPPILSSYYENGQFDDLESYLRQTLQYYHIFAIPTIFGLFFASRDLLEILTTAEIANTSAHIVPISAIGLYFLGLFVILGQSMVLTKATDVTAYMWTSCAAINLVLNLILIPILGIEGAAIVMVITYAIADCCVVLYICRMEMYYFFSLSLGFLAKIALASSLMILIGLLTVPLIPLQESMTMEVKVFIFIADCVIVYFSLLFLLLFLDQRRNKTTGNSIEVP
jgi:O-antigen/teichoic acid export membrane protein